MRVENSNVFLLAPFLLFLAFGAVSMIHVPHTDFCKYAARFLHLEAWSCGLNLLLSVGTVGNRQQAIYISLNLRVFTEKSETAGHPLFIRVSTFVQENIFEDIFSKLVWWFSNRSCEGLRNIAFSFHGGTHFAMQYKIILDRNIVNWTANKEEPSCNNRLLRCDIKENVTPCICSSYPSVLKMAADERLHSPKTVGQDVIYMTATQLIADVMVTSFDAFSVSPWNLRKSR